MKLLTLLATAAAAAQAAVAAPTTTTSKDYFFRYVGGNDVTSGQRLRTNTSASLDFLSPGVPEPPQNPDDHFMRIHANTTRCSPRTVLYVVPTHPHPPPVPGYYGLTDREGSGAPTDGYRLVYTYRLEEQGPGFKYTEWALRGAKEGGGAKALRYAGLSDSEWSWIAVKEETLGGADTWVPFLVKKSEANAAELAEMEFVDVDLVLTVANGPVNSNAPGGVEE